MLVETKNLKMKMIMMRKIILGLTVGLLSFSSYSSELKCSESYDIFQGIIKGVFDVRKNGNLKQIKAHNARYGYTALFKENHPGQLYWYGWRDEREHDALLLHASDEIKIGKSKEHRTMLLKPKADFISSVGEVCIIPMYFSVNYDGKRAGSLTDVFFVRDIQSNQWRVFIYTGNESEEVMDEFFPDLPKRIKMKLSKIKMYN